MDPAPTTLAAPTTPAAPVRYAFFIDGFNLYHALDGPKRLPFHQFRDYKWLNTKKLCQLFTPASATITKIMHFTALAHWDAGKVQRHKTYARALEHVGVEMVYGKFKRRTRDCNACNAQYDSWEEKETDVNIAVNIFKAAKNDEFDTAVMVTGDSDQLPIIRALRDAFPLKKVGVIIPVGRSAEELKMAVDFHHRMKKKHLESALFPRRLDLGGGAFIHCPTEWVPKAATLPAAL